MTAFKDTDHWYDDSDFNEDLFAVSDFCQPENKFGKPSTHVQNARSRPSIHMDDYLEPECKPVRGYPFLRNYMIDPGGQPSFLKQQEQTFEEIRQISGLDYSNYGIEKMLFGDKDNTQDIEIDNIQDVENNIQDVENNNTEDTEDEKINDSELMNHNFTATSSSNDSPIIFLSANSSNCVSPTNQVTTSNHETPSLFELVRNCRKNAKLKHEEKNKSTAPYSINSFLDFPELPKK